MTVKNNILSLVPSMVVSLLISLITMGLIVNTYVIPLYDYDEPPSRIYTVDMRLRLDFYNETTDWIDYDLIDIEIYSNITQRITIHRYHFRLDTRGLIQEPPVFSNIFVYFSVEGQVMEEFVHVELYSRIEDSEMVMDQSDLEQSDDGSGFYIYYVDVANMMWKDDVPDILHGEITLFSRE